MDGQPLPDALAGKPVRLDPGEHRFSFEADGMSRVEKTFTLREGEKGRRETVVFAAVPSPAPAAAVRAADDTKEQPSREERPREEARPSPSPTSSSRVPVLAYVAGGIGVAGLALGIGAGLTASSRNSTLQGECPHNVCPSSAQPDIDAFRTWRDWSTAGYVVAALGLVGGVVLWLTAPKSSGGDRAAQLWIGPRGVGLAESF